MTDRQNWGSLDPERLLGFSHLAKVTAGDGGPSRADLGRLLSKNVSEIMAPPETTAESSMGRLLSKIGGTETG